MTVEERAVDDVIPYARNARKIPPGAIDKVASSIKEFGWRQAIVVDTEGVIVVGHTRLLAAKKLGMRTVPVHVAEGLTPAQIKAYRIMDNRSHEEASWDTELLSVELSELQSMAVDLSLSGFDQDELGKLLKGTGGLTDEDDIPQTPAVAVSQPGDLWMLGRHKVICGNCTDDATVTRLMAGERANYTFTSPPYGIDLEYERDKPIDQLVRLVGGAVNSIHQVSSADAYATMNYADVFLPGAEGFTPMSAHYHEPFTRLGWCLRGNRIWFKPFARLALAYGTSTTMNLREWEYVRTWRKGRGAEKLREHGMTLRGVWKSFGSDAIIPDWRENDVTTDKNIHPAAFPVLLPVAGIRCYTDENAIVFEPFGGSGSVVIACEKTSRRARLVEIDPKYIDVIVTRWQAFTGKKAMLDPDGRSFEEVSVDRKEARS